MSSVLHRKNKNQPVWIHANVAELFFKGVMYAHVDFPKAQGARRCCFSVNPVGGEHSWYHGSKTVSIYNFHSNLSVLLPFFQTAMNLGLGRVLFPTKWQAQSEAWKGISGYMYSHKGEFPRSASGWEGILRLSISRKAFWWTDMIFFFFGTSNNGEPWMTDVRRWQGGHLQTASWWRTGHSWTGSPFSRGSSVTLLFLSQRTKQMVYHVFVIFCWPRNSVFPSGYSM